MEGCRVSVGTLLKGSRAHIGRYDIRFGVDRSVASFGHPCCSGPSYSGDLKRGHYLDHLLWGYCVYMCIHKRHMRGLKR